MGLLGQPLTINAMQLRNRIVMLPMVTNLATESGYVTDTLIAHYAERARKDVGLVVVEASAIRASSRNITHGVGVWEDGMTPGLRRLTDAIHAGGAAAALQIFHAGAKTHPGQTPVSCSGTRLRAGTPPRVIGTDELPGVVADFVEATRRAVEAGFDAVEIHAAHFYLLSEFLSPFTNRRSDGYGGDLAGRTRLAREVVAAVRGAAGPHYPLVVRLHGVERLEGGMSDAEVAESARLLAEAGADAFNVSACNGATRLEDEYGGYWKVSSYLAKDEPAGTAAPLAAAVRRASGRPVIAVGKMGDPEGAERVLAEGGADLVGVGRNFLADPNLATKLLAGDGEAIVRCKQCFACLTRAVGKQQPIRCAVNPRVGRVLD